MRTRLLNSATLLAAPLLGFVWSRHSRLSMVMCASLTLSLVLTFVAGNCLQELMRGKGPRSEAEASAGIFQSLWLGQYAIVGLVLLLSPVVALIHDITGKTIPLRASLPSLLALSLSMICRKLPPRTVYGWFSRVPSSSQHLAAVVFIGVFRAVTLHSTHAGGLGHDTQQHIYWAEHIADYGFLPFASRGTDLLEAYPRFFHVLCAGMAAFGQSPTTGPYVKFATFLVAALTYGFLAELLLSARRPNARTRGLDPVPLLVGVFLAWHLTVGDGQDVARRLNLNGTARFAAGWIVFGLPLLTLAYRVGTLPPVTSRWLLASVPVFFALALGVNPIVALMYVVYTLPLSLLLWVATRGAQATEELPLTRGSANGVPRFRVWWSAVFWSASCTALLFLANTFVVQKLTRFPGVVRTLGKFGIRTTSAGLPGGPWLADDSDAPWCADSIAACAIRTLRAALDAAYADCLSSLSEFRLPNVYWDRRAYVYWAVAAVAVAMAVHSAYAQRALLRSPLRVAVGLLSATTLATFILPLVQGALAPLNQAHGELAMLPSYFDGETSLLQTFMLVVLPLVPLPLVRPFQIAGGAFAALFMVIVAAIGVRLTPFNPKVLVRNRFMRSVGRIDWRELGVIADIERFVKPHETVLIQSLHRVQGGREHVFTANNDVGVIASLLDTRILFAFSLGFGQDYSWPDFETRFCNASPEDRAAFLRQTFVRWVLVRDPHPASRVVYESFRVGCDVGLQELGAAFPPAFHQRDLALYRIDP